MSLSLGILISARTSSQRVAMMGALLGTMLPTMLLSGFIFPIESMPRAAAVDLRTSCRPGGSSTIARGIMLKGVGLDYLWQETLVLAAMALVLLALSTRSFQRAAGVAHAAASCSCARAEVLHVIRDRATLAQVLIVPIVQLLILSNAATFEIRDTPTYVVDLDRTQRRRAAWSTGFAASGQFVIVGQSASTDAGQRGAARAAT